MTDEEINKEVMILHNSLYEKFNYEQILLCKLNKD